MGGMDSIGNLFEHRIPWQLRGQNRSTHAVSRSTTGIAPACLGHQFAYLVCLRALFLSGAKSRPYGRLYVCSSSYPPARVSYTSLSPSRFSRHPRQSSWFLPQRPFQPATSFLPTSESQIITHRTAYMTTSTNFA
jgi:hypothetical protein